MPSSWLDGCHNTLCVVNCQHASAIVIISQVVEVNLSVLSTETPGIQADLTVAVISAQVVEVTLSVLSTVTMSWYCYLSQVVEVTLSVLSTVQCSALLSQPT